MTITVKYLTFILLIALAGCKKHSNPSNSNPYSFSQSSFPVKVGDTWTYQRYDSVSLKIDTVIWSLTDTVSFRGKSFLLCQQTSSAQGVDTGYWAISADTIYIYTTNIINGVYSPACLSYGCYGPSDYFIFPAQSDSTWSDNNIGIGDIYACSVSNNLSVLGKTYYDVFVINRMQNFIGYTQKETIDMEKGIGIVGYKEYYFDPASLSHVNYQLSLISYTIN